MDSCLCRNDKVLKDGDKLRFATEDFDIQSAGLNVIHNAGNHFVGMAVIVADTADTDSRDLPLIAIFNFSDGDMEFITDTTDDGLDHHSFAFQGFIFGDAQVDFTDTDIHVY